MRKSVKRTGAALIALVIVFISAILFYVPVPADETVNLRVEVEFRQTEARQMLEYINRFRTGNDIDGQRPEYINSDNATWTRVDNLQELIYDYSLERTAMQRAAEAAMAMSHTRPNGEPCFTAWEDTVVWFSRGENLAANNSSGNNCLATFRQLREDDEEYSGQGHRRNMLDSGFTHIGIGHVVVNGIHFWAHSFGRTDAGDGNATAAVDEIRGVDMSVLKRDIEAVQASAMPDNYRLKAGERAELPKTGAWLRLYETWPYSYMLKTEIEAAWTSDDASIAAIEGGQVAGVGEGTTYIRADVAGQAISVPVTVTQTPEVYGHSLVLNGQIGVRFYMDLSVLNSAQLGGAHMDFTVGNDTLSLRPDEVFTDNGYYVFTCYVNSLQMAESIRADFYYPRDGGTAVVEDEYSVKEYIDYICSNASDPRYAELAGTARAIANYGHYAQAYLAKRHGFSVGEGGKYAMMPAGNSYLDVEGAKSGSSAFAPHAALAGSDVESIQVGLRLEETTDMMIYAKTRSGAAASGSVSFNGRNYTLEDGRVTISGITAGRLGDVAEISGSADGAFSGRASALSYTYIVLNSNNTDTELRNMAAALYHYYNAFANIR